MKTEVPKTRDRFISNPMVQLINPERKDDKVKRLRGYMHDKLDVNDIQGT